LHDLLVTKRLSKAPSDYVHDVFQAIAARQLEKAGFEVQSGQSVQYLIVDAKNRRVDGRISVAELLTSDTKYDVHEYLEMLMSATETLLGVFGYTKDRIRVAVLHHEKQTMLKQN
jgi:DNA polymerase elongation subunit (family B)